MAKKKFLTKNMKEKSKKNTHHKNLWIIDSCDLTEKTDCGNGN